MKRLVNVIIVFTTIYSISCTKSGSEESEPVVPPESQSRLTQILDSLRRAHNLPALAGAVVADTGVIEARAVGSRRYNGPANVADNDEFHLGSDTKAITSALIATLVDDSLLTWDTTLPDIFPEYSSTMRTEYKTVTVRDLLSHGAGFMANPTITPTRTTTSEQRAEVVAWAFSQPPSNPKGTYNYSNLGYIIAGAIVDKVAGKSYEDLLAERILQPLGITTAGFGPMGTVGRDDQPLQHTPNYQPVDPLPENDNPPIFNSAGRLHMSIGDWGKYVRWVLACEAGRPTLLRGTTAAALTTGITQVPGGGSYAMGWMVVPAEWAGGPALTHAGSNTMNYAVAWLAPGRKFAVISATNICANSTPSAMDAVSGRLIQFYLYGN